MDPLQKARELRHHLVPRFVTGSGSRDPGAGLLRLDPSLGLGIEPWIRQTGSHRPATPAELSAIVEVGEPLAHLYRRNLGGLLREADLLSIGGATADEAYFLDLDTSLPGVEACLLLPELWDQARRTLGRDVWAALPDRAHCRFLPAGPWRFVVEMVPDLVSWHEQGSEPLCRHVIVQDGRVLRAGPPLAALLSK